MPRKKAKPSADDALRIVLGSEGDDRRPNQTVSPSRAICHPGKPNYAEGWCQKCFEVKRQLGPQTIDGKLENELKALHRGVEHIQRMAHDAEAILQNNLTKYASMHMAGAAIAASQGDTKPAEWALERIGMINAKPVVAPAARGADDGASSGVKVFVGVKIGGLADTAGGMIEAEVVKKTPDS